MRVKEKYSRFGANGFHELNRRALEDGIFYRRRRIEYCEFDRNFSHRYVAYLVENCNLIEGCSRGRNSQLYSETCENVIILLQSGSYTCL